MRVVSEHEIKKLLDREDIENLLALGAPNDEYESEAEMIHIALKKLSRDQPQEITPDRIIGIIKKVWQQMFDHDDQQLATREPAFRKIATQICASAGT